MSSNDSRLSRPQQGRVAQPSSRYHLLHPAPPTSVKNASPSFMLHTYSPKPLTLPPYVFPLYLTRDLRAALNQTERHNAAVAIDRRQRWPRQLQKDSLHPRERPESLRIPYWRCWMVLPGEVEKLAGQSGSYAGGIRCPCQETSFQFVLLVLQ